MYLMKMKTKEEIEADCLLTLLIQCQKVVEAVFARKFTEKDISYVQECFVNYFETRKLCVQKEEFRNCRLKHHNLIMMPTQVRLFVLLQGVLEMACICSFINKVEKNACTFILLYHFLNILRN